MVFADRYDHYLLMTVVEQEAFEASWPSSGRLRPFQDTMGGVENCQEIPSFYL